MRFTEIRHRWRFSLVAGALRVWGATIRLSAFSHILNVRSYRFHRSLAMRR